MCRFYPDGRPGGTIEEMGHFFIDDRHNQQGQQHRTGKPSYQYPCQSVFPFGACSRCGGDRKHTENHGEGGHENRADAHSSGIDQRCPDGFTGSASFVGAVNDQYGILLNQSDHHDQTQNGKDVDGVAGQSQREDSSDQRYGNGK